MYLAPTNPARRLNHAALANHRTPPNADARRGNVLAGLRGRTARRVQVAAELHIGHDDGTATQRDVGCASDGAAAGDFVA